MKKRVAVGFQGGGILALSGGLGWYRAWLGLVSLGVLCIVFGVSLERES
jgi:hypothetical protein